jgi:hypothetical protein
VIEGPHQPTTEGCASSPLQGPDAQHESMQAALAAVPCPDPGSDSDANKREELMDPTATETTPSVEDSIAMPVEWPALPGPGVEGVFEEADPATVVHYVRPARSQAKTAAEHSASR